MKQSASGVMSVSVQLGALRTGDLRELLEDEDKINDIIRCDGKLQRLQRAAEKVWASNQNLAKVSLSHKPTLRDAKLLLAMNYKELGKLKSIIQAKQERLAEKNSVQFAQWCLLRKINQAEEDCELLFQRFAEGKMMLADFLDSFLSSRKFQHISLVLVKKLQEMIELKLTQRLGGIQPCTKRSSAGSLVQVCNACLPVCSLNTGVVFSACCLPPLLLPCGTHVNTGHCLQHSPSPLDYTESLQEGARGRGNKWPARPVRLQPLEVHLRRHQQAPK